MFRIWCIFILLFFVIQTQAQTDATYKEYDKEYLTYAFSDPDPIPSGKKIYPYFRFDGFSTEGAMQNWKVVELENDFIRVLITPEIGGKIWTAQEKKTGKHFLYNNEVVKFRDIALRGPWVSGGIEFNFGIIGHTANTATPVDYLVKKNDDGSVSCFISSLDLLTRTRWVLEVKLEKDKAYFITNTFWTNSTAYDKPYYTWMNAAVPARNDLQFLYPGTNSIGHEGETTAWPFNEKGANLSRYSDNAFGGSKSYHILGSHSNYFGVFYEAENFGMVHYSRRNEKLGKKIFLWAQSGRGGIWEDLLTDDSGQYVEIQSGRLFNQNQFGSSFTPFKQIGFAPYSSESLSEYWYPFMSTDGFTGANLVGAFNFKRTKRGLSVKLSPVQALNDTLKIYGKDNSLLYFTKIEAAPMELVKIDLKPISEGEPSYAIIKDVRIEIDKKEKELSRPLEIPEEFDPETSFGLFLQGRDLARFRNFDLAEEKIKASLKKDPLFVPSLVEMAKLKLHRIQNDSAFYFSKRALSINTYHGEANYYYGLAASRLGRDQDALDGFEVASLDVGFGNAAFTALSRHYFKEMNLKVAKEYANEALVRNQENMEALQILHLIARIQKDNALLKETQRSIEDLNPLNHFLRFEEYYVSKDPEDKKDFTELIRNEMPVETYLELAIWYSNLSRMKESREILEMAPINSISLYWLAWLYREDNPERSAEYLIEAERTSPEFVFPFREETVNVLEWARTEQPSWKVDYFLALIHNFRGNKERAQTLVENNNINFAPYYIFKTEIDNEIKVEEKLELVQKAVELDPEQWRYGRILANTLIGTGQNEKAVEVLQKHYSANKNNYVVGMDLVNALIIGEKYQDAEKVLNELNILPFEGATSSRKLYRETKLALAYRAMEEGKYEKALMKIEEAEEWPKSLGVGKPYPDQIDSDLENALKALVYQEMKNNKLYGKYKELVKDKTLLEEPLYKRLREISSNKDQRLF